MKIKKTLVILIIVNAFISFSGTAFAKDCERFEKQYNSAKKAEKKAYEWLKGANWLNNNNRTHETERELRKADDLHVEAEERKWAAEDRLDECTGE